MYGYKEYAPLDMENILNRVTEKEILGIVFTDEDIILNKGALYRAPYRDDKDPGCWFEEYNGKILFVDFADTKITKQNLIDDGVIPVEIYRFNSRRDNIVTIRPMDICYAYTQFEDNRCKIYRPYGNEESKWLTNCNQNDVGSYDKLPESGSLLIITKSYKDCRVLRNYGFNSIWLQNEGMFPNIKILKELCKRFTKIVVWFDNDNTGITSSRLLVSIINDVENNKARSITLPPILLQDGIKDPSDLISKKGEEILTNFLIKKKLLKI